MTLERVVDARELAELMGVTPVTIKRWTAAGMPAFTLGRRLRRYRPSEAIAWAEKRFISADRSEEDPS
jgi:phage terminase Nu1 subunit (DNA packaging protein)